MKQANIISLEGNKISVLDMQELAKMAEGLIVYPV
jgi:hypothetical protein